MIYAYLHYAYTIRIPCNQESTRSRLEYEYGKNASICSTAKIDPIGIGSIARSRDRNWNEEEWSRIYPTVQLQVHVNSNFVSDDM
ncbi:Ger(x)C family spore germination C-terminal domain-containing protein [Paenibacillus provencensis]|uniref:Ger(X)C family spore germination C-terminal domain-containing protein n=1 Tax=Paenibacillus provencensis TaxID=441151 RepID=A0ABW3PZI8_9BACL